jgi:hypothetical protein
LEKKDDLKPQMAQMAADKAGGFVFSSAQSATSVVPSSL